jgi:DNA-binding response OmpR family regulator
MQRTLNVEPDPAYRGRTSGALAPLSCDIVLLDDAESAIQAMMAEMPALVIAGCDEPQESELRMVRLARQGSRPVPVLVLARTGSTRGAIDFSSTADVDSWLMTSSMRVAR